MILKWSVLLLIAVPFVASAGAWNKKKGSGYAQVSYTFLSYNRLLQGSEKSIGLKRRIYDQTIQYYEEYGISDKFNLLINIPYKFVSSANELNTGAENDPYTGDTLESGSLNGFSNLMLGTRIQLYNKKYVVSFQLLVQNKMHQYDPSSGMRIGYEAWLFTPSLLFGKGWDRSWIQGEAGAQLNTNQYSQNFIGNFEYGIKMKDRKTMFMFRIDAKIPVTTGTYNEGSSVQTGLFRDNSSYISPGIKFTRQFLNQWFINLAAYGAFFSENEGANATLNAGLAYEW